jgi:uncharacterized protein
MRVTPADVPRRPLGLRGWLIGAAVAFVFLLLSVRGLARFYTDYLWFEEVGFTDTWRSLLGAKAIPALIFSAVFFVLLLANLIVADRIAPRYRATAGPEDEIIERYRTYVAPYAGRLRVIVALFFALVMGGGVSAEWRSWVLFSNSVDFGVDDPQFGRDIGFYVFRLPFLEFAVGWVFAALLVVLIVTAVFHYLNGGIRLQSPWQRVTPQVKVHLSVILALMALTKTAQYYLARYELVFSQRGFVEGAGFTDVKAQLPALNLLMIISIAAAALFIANIFRKGWVFPIIAVGLWAFISLVVGTIYPAVIQRVRVEPNEFERESPYIERNIEATREAFGIGGIVDEEFDYAADLDAADVEAHQATLANIRLWDPAPTQAVYGAQDEDFSFYRVSDVDVDRYRVGDQMLPATVSVRELDQGGIPEGTWTNRHLVYTHGFGVVASTANLAVEGEPSYLISGFPPAGELAADLEPGVYFGEGASGYTVVDTNVPEQQAASGETTEEIRYSGAAGVETSNFIRRTALALRFADWNLFVSGQIDGDSRVLYKRDVRERAATAAPFLRFDADPYPVVLDGRVLWVLDAYTISDRYPYSESLRPTNLPPGSGLNARFNYVRNSVKATVDAYDGTIRFYVIDESDPLIQAYQGAFPELFSSVSEMPEGLREHWRYPEDLFRAQSEHFALYHMTNPADFYRKELIWDVVPNPGTGGDETDEQTTQTTIVDTEARETATLAASGNPIPPYYLTMQLPGEQGQEFVLMRPYTPRGKPNQLSSFLVARNDGEHYGKLVSYEVPNSDAPSPAEAKTLIESERSISEQFSLLDQRGSRVIRGSVQLLPIGNSIVYARPVYVEGRGEGAFPRLRFVAVAYQDRAVLVDFEGGPTAITSIDQAMRVLLSGEEVEPPAEEEPTEEEPAPPEEEEPTEPTVPTVPPSEPGDPGEDATVDELIAAAEQEFQAAEDALRAGGPGALSLYEGHIARARDFVDRANSLLAQTTTTSTAPVVNASQP